MSGECLYGTPDGDARKVIWEITNNCNMNCVHCCNHIERKGIDIDLPRTKQILDELIHGNVRKVVIGGGEPLLFKYIDVDLTTLSKNNIKITLSTNGSLLERKIHLLYHLSGLKVILSLDGATPDTHDSFRRTDGAFKKTLKAIKLLKNINNVKVKLAATIHNKNIHEISEIVRFVESEKIVTSFHSIVKTKSNEKIIDDYLLPSGKYREFQMEFVDSQYAFFKRWEAGEKNTICPAGKDFLGVRANGMFTPCHWLSYKTSLYDTKSMMDLRDFKMEKAQLLELPCHCDSQ